MNNVFEQIMTDVKYMCQQHGLQYVDEMILPGNLYILNCGCVYSASYHGSNYRIKTPCCDKCGLIIIDTCLITSGGNTRFYHVDCAKELGVIENGKIIKIDEYPDYDVQGLNNMSQKKKVKG